MKFKLYPYHSNSDYIEHLEKCQEICQKIYICRNISLNKAGIIEQLKEIDKLMADNNGHKDRE